MQKSPCDQCLKQNKAEGAASQFSEAVLPALNEVHKHPTHFFVTANVIVRWSPDR